MNKPEVHFHYRGPVERLRFAPQPGKTRLRVPDPWRDGYSENGPGGGVLYPWMTYRECQMDAQARGARAVFHHPGREGVRT